MKTRDAIAGRAQLGRTASAPSGLAARIRAARNLRRAIRWPGTDIEIGVRILSRQDLAEAQAAAALIVKGRGIDESKMTVDQANRVGAEYTVQVLWRALYESPAPDAPRLFATAADLDAEATEDEVFSLLSAYDEFRVEMDPELEELPAQQWEAFVESVKKKEASRSSSIASSMPRPWLLSLVSRLASSATWNLPSTPSDDESSSESTGPDASDEAESESAK